jgi:spoIIIJ-associated protein
VADLWGHPGLEYKGSMRMTAEKTGEFRGKTVELAISAGLAEWHVARTEVEIEVVRPGSRGVLGIGAEDAIVRLTLVRPAKQDVRPAQKPEQRPAQHSEARSIPRQPEPGVVTGEARTPSAPTPDIAEAPAAGMGVEVEIPAAVQLGSSLLGSLLEKMGFQAIVEIVPQSAAEADEGDRVLVLNVIGEDLGVLIGRQSEVLLALEFITRLMVNQQSHSRSNFVIDVNGYRAKRAESLRKLALRMADQAMQSGRTLALEPMHPAERRIIHLTLRDHPSVRTQSIGEGERRKVTIIPKRG